MPTTASNNSPQAAITLTLLCHSNQSQISLVADLDQSVGSLLGELIERLEQGDNGEQIALLRECYEPILQCVQGHEAISLANHHSLEAAGLRDGDRLQIAAEPRKEKLLFCRYSKQG